MPADPITLLILGCVALAAAARTLARLQARSVDVRGSSAWRRRHPNWPALPDTRPIEQLSADLRRLQAACEAIERGDPPMKAARLRAAAMAYDEVLLQACRVLEVDVAPEQRRPLRPLERLQTEAELARAGLRW